MYSIWDKCISSIQDSVNLAHKLQISSTREKHPSLSFEDKSTWLGCDVKADNFKLSQERKPSQYLVHFGQALVKTLKLEENFAENNDLIRKRRFGKGQKFKWKTRCFKSACCVVVWIRMNPSKMNTYN